MTTTNILENIYSRIIARTADIIAFELDENNRLIFTNSAPDSKLVKIDLKGVNLADFDVIGRMIHADDVREVMTLFEKMDLNQCRSVICRILCADCKSYRWFRITICNFYDAAYGNYAHRIGMLQDVDSEFSAFKRIKEYEEYDSLTGLYNEEKFEEAARALIRFDKDIKYCIIMLDINKFKAINERYGYKNGNNILKYVASVVKNTIPDNAVCARLYADSYGIFMQYEKEEDIVSLVRLLYDKIRTTPYNIAVLTSYGIFLADTADKLFMNVRTMKDRALIAKAMIKREAVNYYAFFTDEFSNEIIMEQDVEKDMYRALKEGEFMVYLQPKVSLSTERLIGAEALIRWKHPDKGVIAPDNFVPIFEKNGFIMQLDRYVCEEVCRFLHKMMEEGRGIVPISVNLSRLHVYNGAIVEYLLELIEKYNIPPHYLRFEITETSFITNMDALIDIVEKLRNIGFKVEMDDFGSGYSSLNMLRNVPVDTIKIDKEFFDKKLDDEKGKIVISHTIAMAKELKLEVLAEGVETEEHAKFLRESNCDLAQGYLFSRPMTLVDFEEKFMSRKI